MLQLGDDNLIVLLVEEDTYSFAYDDDESNPFADPSVRQHTQFTPSNQNYAGTARQVRISHNGQLSKCIVSFNQFLIFTIFFGVHLHFHFLIGFLLSNMAMKNLPFSKNV